MVFTAQEGHRLTVTFLDGLRGMAASLYSIWELSLYCRIDDWQSSTTFGRSEGTGDVYNSVEREATCCPVGRPRLPGESWPCP